jgi:hypothetical protein
MPYNPRSYHVKDTAAEQAQRAELAILCDRYEAIRLLRGPDRDAVDRELSLALARFGRGFTHGLWIYQWSRAQDSITRMPVKG